MNITIDSCKGNASANFELDLNSIQDMAVEREEHWLPVYVDNTDWKEIEFVCHMHIYLNPSDEKENFSDYVNSF